MIKIKQLLMLLLAVSFLSSCSEDDEVPSPNEAALDYYPHTKGSTWTYEGTLAYTVTSMGTNKVIDGKSYHEYEQVRGSSKTPVYMSKESGVYTVTSTQPGVGTVTLTMLKDNVAEGATWENEIPSNNIVNKYKFTLVKKGLIKTVAGKEFKDVIQVKLDVSVEFMGTTFPSGAPAYNYFYAKGVGLIHTDMGTMGSSSLKTYSIK